LDPIYSKAISDHIIANSASWVACNVEGSYKRAVILATVIGFGNMNGAVTSNVVSRLSHRIEVLNLRFLSHVLLII
jgi:hypothetical protein